MAKYPQTQKGKDDFTLDAIPKLRKEGYKGMHTVFSGYNNAFKKYFNGADPIDHTTSMQKRKLIVIIPVAKGVQLYMPKEAPVSKDNGDKALELMGC